MVRGRTLGPQRGGLIRMGLMENMMVEGVGVDGKGCTNLKGNLRTKLSEIKEP